ncbi:MAG: UDP-2,3-diacylglucosamine diphosphatase [Ferrimonas sp.]
MGDLHLSAERPDILAAFQRFLTSSELQSADALYIVGDLFEAWIGDDDRSPFNEQVAQLLQHTSRYVPIYFSHGNRDFLLSKRFAKRAGITLLPEIHHTQLYGRPTVILHGDLLCLEDLAYQSFRRRWPWYRILSRILPLNTRRQLAVKARTKSKARTADLATEIMDVSASAVEALLTTTHSSLMIHGHTHRPAIHQLKEGKQRAVVGDWYSQDSVLEVTAAGLTLHSNPLTLD